MTKITIERETLLPCPFCGCGAAITGTEWGGREQYFVACTGPDCHCAVGENYDRDACPEYSFSSKAEAIAAWNRRAALAVQPADNADFESWLSTNPIPAGASMKQAMWIAYAAASKRIAAQPAEPVAWLHIQGNHTEPSLMRLDDDEIARGWKEIPLYPPPAPAAVPLTDEKIDHTLATTLDEFARTTRGMSHALDVNADITANSRLRRMFARAVLAAGDKP